MEFLKYSNETQTNIFPKENFEMLAHEVFDIIANNICRSLGPLGSSATILDGISQPEATKDGYAILNTYAFRNDYKRMIYNLFKAPCTKMNNTVGDGTTTGIALANAMYNRYENVKYVMETLYRLPRQFTKAWDWVVADLRSRIADKAVDIDPTDYDTIYNISYVTSNGNEEISAAMAKVYSEAETPFIKQKDSPSNKSYIDEVTGFNFPANLLDDIYVRNQDMTAIENDIAAMVFDFTIETDFLNSVIKPINSVCRALGKKLLILAPAFDRLMCDTELEQFIKMEFRTTGINLINAQYPTGKLKPHQLLDLCTILRTKIINTSIAAKIQEEIKNTSADKVVDLAMNDPEYELSRIVGCAAKAILSISDGAIFTVDDIESDETYQDRLRAATNELNHLIDTTDDEKKSYTMKIYDARERVLQLKMKNYIYYIGADSQLQKSIIWDSVNDVIKCVRSAVKSGVVPGCQLTIIRSCDELLAELPDDDDGKLKKEIVALIRNACCDVYSRVLNGPDDMGMIKLCPRWYCTTKDGHADLIKEASEKCFEIITTSIEKNEVFDLETLDYNPAIITSAETDQMVLLAASELVKILISGNQAIIVQPNVDTSHEEKKDIYV